MKDLDKKIIELMDLFDDEVVTTADKIDRPQRALDREAIDDFMDRNPMAGGGMLVQPSADGSRPGYSGEYGPNIRESKKSNSFEVTIERGKKVFNKSFNFKTYGSKEKALEAAKEYRNEKSKLTDTRGDKKGGFGAGAPGGSKEQTGGKAKIEKILNNFIKEGKTSFSNADIKAKMKVENFYKSDLNFRRAVDVIKKQPEYKNLTFIKKPRVENPDEAAKLVRKKRQEGLKETDTTKAKGTKKYPFHHIRQITGGVPLTTDDVVIINQRMNSVMSQYDKSLNAIASAIQKNNRLALEAMNAKDEGAALKYMARVDELNETAEKIVNSAIKKLPKKYDGLVGFNQFTLPRNEYGLPISNEPMIVKKVGGMPISKNAIDLTTLNLKNEQEFRKIVRAQAEAGKTGQINKKQLDNLFLKLSGQIDKDCAGAIKQASKDGGRIGLQAIGSRDVCITKAKNYARDQVAKGIPDTGVKGSLIKRIFKSTNNFVKSALDPKELFDIKKQFFSKGAIASLPIFDAGIAGYEALAMNKPVKEAISNTFTFGSIPRAMGIGLDQPDVLQAKQLLNNPNLSPAGKEYAQLLIDLNDYANLQRDATPLGITRKFNKFNELQNKIKSASTAGKFDYQSLLDETQATQLAKDQYSPLIGNLGDPLKNRAVAPRTGTRQGPGPVKIDLSPITYENFEANIPPKEEFDEYLRSKNLIGQDQELTEKEYQRSFYKPAEFEQLMEVPGFKGASEKFAGGGIAKLAGVDQGPPPESGPNSQGLQGLIKRVKNI
jgi:hypothetical protein